MHEKSLHDKSCFLTLTYRPGCVPRGGSLCKRDLSLFLKRLRKELRDTRIRFFGCGEYGEKFARPHYHLLLFGVDFSFDRQFIGRDLYTSPTVDRLWPWGFHSLGEVTDASAAYVARYCLKKAFGKQLTKDFHYGKRVAEFTQMSRRPGIASGWFDKFKFDVYKFDLSSEGVLVDGKIFRPPRFYDKLLDREMPEMLKQLKLRRKEKAKGFALNSDQLDAFDKQLRYKLSLFNPRTFEGIQ